VNLVRESFPVAAHNLKRAYWALVPVLDFLRDRFDIVGYRALTQAGIGDGNQCRSDLVDKVSPHPDRLCEVGIESDFVPAHLVTHQKDELAQGALRLGEIESGFRAAEAFLRHGAHSQKLPLHCFADLADLFRQLDWV